MKCGDRRIEAKIGFASISLGAVALRKPPCLALGPKNKGGKILNLMRVKVSESEWVKTRHSRSRIGGEVVRESLDG